MMKTAKVIVAGWITVNPQLRDKVVESFRPMVRRARRAHGCIDFAISGDPVVHGRINTFEFWRSAKALEAWRAVANPPKEITAMRRVEVQKHIVGKSGPPFDD